MLLQIVDESGARGPVVALLATLDPARAASRTKGLSIRTPLCRHEDSSREVLLLLQPRQPDGKLLFPMAGAVMKQDVPASVGPIIATAGLNRTRYALFHYRTSHGERKFSIRLPEPLGR